MGKSRSVTIVLAYLLSTRPQTCPDIPTALALVRQTRPHAEPNSGFMAQLELYRAMGYPSDVDSQPMYQRWLYQQEVQMSLAVGRAPDRLRFEDEKEGSIRDIETSEIDDGQQAKAKELRCRKCRRTLATQQYLIPHSPKSAPDRGTETTTSPIASLPSNAVQPQPCTHHFIHPLSWMRPTLSEGQLSGRLECPNTKCGQQVGRYAWQGLKCSCGHWITPGFSLAGGKVDEVQSRPSGAGAMGVRMPPGMGRGREKGSL
jgi:dual specificity phosphatase 12